MLLLNEVALQSREEVKDPEAELQASIDRFRSQTIVEGQRMPPPPSEARYHLA
jgi:hypothetical protein